MTWEHVRTVAAASFATGAASTVVQSRPAATVSDTLTIEPPRVTVHAVAPPELRAHVLGSENLILSPLLSALYSCLIVTTRLPCAPVVAYCGTSVVAPRVA